MAVTFFKNIKTDLMRLGRKPMEARFIKHNKQVFERVAKQQDKCPVILMELSSMQSSHIAYSYLANVLSKETSAKIIGYAPQLYSSPWKRLAFRVAKYFGLSYLGIYRSFGVTDFFFIEINKKQKQKARLIYKKITSQLNDKWDLEAITVNGTWIGDLIYDTYLAKFKKPTIDTNNSEFLAFLLESIELFVFWEDYLDIHDVRAINVSHCVYNLAMPLRLGLKKNIPVFQANATHIYRMNRKNYFAYNDFFYYRECFAQLPDAVKKAGVEEAKCRLERRFAGEVGVDMPYSKKSAYVAPRHKKLLRPSARKKILIATHCFFDSPHSYGNNVFPDFYEWLDFLGQLSAVTNYDWYIKTHPDYLPGTMQIIEAFIEKYPRFSLLPSDASHHQIIAEGVDVALTVHGTIAFEYAALGVPVINCSPNNPHIAYEFNLHPRSPEEYRHLLLNLDHLDFHIDKQQVYEYYFMHFLYNNDNLFFDDYNSTLDKLGGYSEQFTPAVYREWIDEWTQNKHASIFLALSDFIQSGDFRMSHRHFGREFNLERIGTRT